MLRIILISLILAACTGPKPLPANVDSYCYGKMRDLQISHNAALNSCEYPQ